MAQKVATVHKMKSRQETTSLGQIVTVTEKPTISTSIYKHRHETASYPDVSLLMKMCGSSPVTRFALASAMRKTKRLRRRLDTRRFKIQMGDIIDPPPPPPAGPPYEQKTMDLFTFLKTLLLNSTSIQLCSRILDRHEKTLKN